MIMRIFSKYVGLFKYYVSKRKILILLVFFILIAYYAFIAITTRPLYGHTSLFYNWQVDAFLAGQIHLPVHLDKSRILNPNDTLEGIYDCARYAWSSGLGDLSTHNGKIYMYWGVTPAIFLYLPYRLLSGMHRLPDQGANFFFGAGTLLWTVKILFLLRRNYFKKTPDWLIMFITAVIGVSNLSPYLIRVSGVYEVPIAATSFFLTGALYYYFRVASKSVFEKKTAFLGSIFLGLSFGCRPYLYVASIPLILLMFIYLRKSKKLTLTNATIILGPPVICMLLLLLYNYIRFGNAFDCGAILSNITFTLYGYIIKDADFANIIPNMYLFFFNPPVINNHFPFVYVKVPVLPPTIYGYGNLFDLVPTAGLFFGAPFSLLLIVGPLIYFLNMRNESGSPNSRVVVLRKAIIRTVYIYYIWIFIKNFMTPFHNSSFLRIIYFYLENGLKEIPLIFMLSIVLFANICLEVKREITHSKIVDKTLFAKTEFGLLAGLIGGLIFCLSHIRCGWYLRYEADYATLVLLLAAILWLYFDEALETRPLYRNYLRTCGFLLGLASILFGIAFAITGFV